MRVKHFTHVHLVVNFRLAVYVEHNYGTAREGRLKLEIKGLLFHTSS